jgi:hypothetical protein
MDQKPVSKLKERFQNQLIDLKKRQRKYELIVQVAEYLADLPEKEKDYPDVAEEVAVTFSAFATKFLDRMEAQEPEVAPAQVTPTTKPRPKLQPKEAGVEDKLQFLMQHRHLENKAVKGLTDDNQPAEGVVKGLDAPYLVVYNKETQQEFRIKPSTIQGA